MARVPETVLRAAELEIGMVVRRWPGVGGPVDREVDEVMNVPGPSLRVFLIGRLSPLKLVPDDRVVVRTYSIPKELR